MAEFILKVYLQPRSSKNKIVGPYRDGIKVRVTAAPVKGKANDALLRLLARECGVAPSSLAIVSGHSFREKIVRITTSLDKELKRKLHLPQR